MNLAATLLGPLAGQECRRGVARGWLILVRTLAAVGILGVALVVFWIAWAFQRLNPTFQPFDVFRRGLLIVEGMMLTVALVLTPAVLAGSLAGEKERGALGLLLTTHVTSREIVAGRLVGKLTQVAMTLLAGVPAVVLLAALAGMNLDVMTTLMVLPTAVAFGGGGIAAAVSAISRRGRDALMSVYFIDLVFLLAPLLAAPGQVTPALSAVAYLNPFMALRSLVWGEEIGPAAISATLWSSIGLAGVAIASWRLAPSCLRELDGGRTGRRSARRGKVRPIDDERPMLWKELFVDRVATLGGIGRWIAAILTWLLGAGSLGLGAIMLWEVVRGGEGAAYDGAKSLLESTVGGSGWFLTWLIEWGVGLRAAVSIASERERGTWDAILTSPLDAKEILHAKLWGSLYALRRLFAAALVAWWIAAIAEAIPIWQAIDWTLQVLVVSTFMAVVGLRSSLASATATRAMAVTIGIWLGAQFATQFVVGLLYAFVGLMILLAMGAGDLPAIIVTLVSSRAFQQIIWNVGLASVYAGLTVALFAYTQVLFDRLAGRRSADELAVAAERFLHGSPADHRPSPTPEEVASEQAQ